MTSVFLHVDMDAFYVSVEELENPALRGLPVIVGGPRDERGVVAAASYAARKFGVHSAMPSRTAARLCPQAIFLPPRFELYQERSRQVHAVLCAFAPQVQMVSVDEAYLDITGCERLYGTALEAATQLRDRLVSATRLPCSIGASSSHLVCKVASDYAKPRGLLWVLPGGEAAFLSVLSVEKIPGIGKVTAAALARIGIRTMGDIRRTDPALLDELFGNFGPVLRRKALGQDADDASWGAFGHSGSDEAAKSISQEHTFAQDETDPARLSATLARMVEQVARRLRAQGGHARTVQLKLRDPEFRTLTRARTLPEATDVDAVLLAAARELFTAHHAPRDPLRLLGFGVTGIQAAAGQLSLLEQPQRERWTRALAAADRLRARHGNAAVRLGGTLPGPGKAGGGE